jgi:hypothetical protein
MLSSIHPLGERARGNHYWRTATAHVAGAVVGGAFAGGAAGLAGAALGSVLPSGAVAWVVLVAGAAALIVDASLQPLALWPHRQVDDRWIGRYRGWVYGGGFGAQLGAGLTTVVVAATVYLLFAVIVAAGSPALGALLGGLFGLVRGLGVLVSARASTPAQLAHIHRRLDGVRRRTPLVAIAGDGAIVAGALVAVWRTA